MLMVIVIDFPELMSKYRNLNRIFFTLCSEPISRGSLEFFTIFMAYIEQSLF